MDGQIELEIEGDELVVRIRDGDKVAVARLDHEGAAAFLLVAANLAEQLFDLVEPKN